MTTKITITLSQDEQHGTDEGMAETVALLAALGVVPTRKVVLTLECKDEDTKQIRDDIRVTLMQRPIGIAASIKTTQDEEVYREPLATITPMDKTGWN